MRGLFAAALFMALVVSSSVQSTTFGVLGVEYGLQAGFSQNWGSGCGSFVDGHGSNCVFLPPGERLVSIRGTETVKRGNIELLARLLCGMGGDAVTVWEAEHFQGTVLIEISSLPADYHLQGDGWRACWIEWQAINGNAYTGSGGGMEFQLVLTTE